MRFAKASGSASAKGGEVDPRRPPRSPTRQRETAGGVPAGEEAFASLAGEFEGDDYGL